MILHRYHSNNVTIIQNRFIDEYMVSANGEFVKVYLLLLRCASSNEELSLTMVADALNHTEGDVKRALFYWEKLHLLQLTFDSKGDITDIAFTEPSSLTEKSQQRVAQYANTITSSQEEKNPQAPAKVPSESSRIYISAKRKQELSANEEVKQLLFVAEQYLGKQLSATEVNNLLYFYDELHLSPDVIEYLVDYCVSKGNKSIHYIRSIAYEWAKKGIRTVEDAKKDSSLYHKEYYTILKTFGIKNRGPAEAEIAYMDQWLNELKFDMELIQEACNRTITRIHTPSFPYADSILQNWCKNGVKQLSDVEKLVRSPEKTSADPSPAPAEKAPKKDFGFKQREYDFDELEAQLLNY